MTLTGLLAFASGAVMARFNKEPDPKEARIAELEALCTRMGETISSLSTHLKAATAENAALRFERNALRQSIGSLIQQRLGDSGIQSAVQAAPRERIPYQPPRYEMPVDARRPTPEEMVVDARLFRCTCVPSRADMLRDLTIFNEPWPGPTQ
jgi:hypothetical protein